MEESDCPYRAEYAKSNRSKCKACKVGIEKDHLRLAVMIQSPLFDGKVPNWYHFNCFFIKQRPKDATDIAHFESIRWEDQEKIKTKLVSLIGTSITPVSRKKKSGTKNPDFNVEYAKSGRAGCCGCQEKIVKNDVRIGKMDYESEEAHRFGGLNRWYHVECFVKLREELEFRGSASSLNGYNILNVEDKNNLTNLLPILATKRTIATNSDKTDGPSSSKKSKLIDKDLEKKAQNKLLFKYIDFLKSLKNSTCKELLEFNKQEVPNSNLGEIYDRLSDLMAFGTLLPCGECNGQLVFRSGIGYQCSGFKNEWLKCEKVLVNPPRKEFVVPSHLLENNDFFVTYKSKIQKRIFTLIDKTTNIKETSTVKNEKGAVRVTRILPLRNMEFTTLMKGSELKDIKFQVAKHGGTLISQCTENVAAVFANQEMIGKKSVKVKDAEEHNIEVVEPTSFFDAIANGRNAIEFIVEKNLASWGGNAKKRIKKRQNELETEQIHKSGLKSKVYGKSMYEKSVPTSVKLTLKGGVPVEPQSGLEHKTHVYKHKNEIWNANLCLSDVQTGKNSYYKLQLLESDNNKKYWVFRSWGRIGTTIGGFKTQDFDTLDEAQEQFQLFYEEQTGNVWGNKNFVKVPGKKVPVDTDYGQDETKALDTVSKIPCKLPDPVQSLIRLLFDVESMKKVMYEFELDLQKMPLGKLSRKQLQKAYSLLSDLMSIIDISDNGNKREKIIMTTNKFYTLIPHDFGVKTPQLIDSNEIINAKLEMIGSLMEIQIAYDMIDVKTQEDSIVHPLDTHYLKLNCGIDVLNTDMREFSIIEQYVKNTHAETHNTYSLKIKDVFKILRTGEEKRFKPFKKLHNRKLLWHGSRITNFAAILSQGLRIAPKEAPVTGYMFGKGIYFADMVSKSANYCMASHGNNTGLLLLCEVALGNMDEHKQSIYIEKLPSGKHSCMGIGRTIPDPTESLLIDNKVEVPLGKPIPSNIDDTSLLYNEFIVYDISQVKLRYLVKVEFNFNF